MRIGIDFTLEHLFSAGNCKRDDFLAQMLARAIHFLFDLGIGAGLDALGFSAGVVLGLIDDFGGTFLRLCNDVGCLAFGVFQLLGGSLLGQFLLMLATLCRGKTVGNLLLALFQCIDQRRPDKRITDQTKRKNVIDWPISVKLIFIREYRV